MGTTIAEYRTMVGALCSLFINVFCWGEKFPQEDVTKAKEELNSLPRPEMVIPGSEAEELEKATYSDEAKYLYHRAHYWFYGQWWEWCKDHPEVVGVARIFVFKERRRWCASMNDAFGAWDQARRDYQRKYFS